MSKQYLTDRQWDVVSNLKSKGARFLFEDLANGKHMMIACMPSGEQRNLIAVNSSDLYAFSDL